MMIRNVVAFKFESSGHEANDILKSKVKIEMRYIYQIRTQLAGASRVDNLHNFFFPYQLKSIDFF